jgi:hypothetical protein
MQAACSCAVYIPEKLKVCAVKASTIVRGVSVGGELEYTDELTSSPLLALLQKTSGGALNEGTNPELVECLSNYNTLLI